MEKFVPSSLPPRNGHLVPEPELRRGYCALGNVLPLPASITLRVARGDFGDTGQSVPAKEALELMKQRFHIAVTQSQNG